MKKIKINKDCIVSITITGTIKSEFKYLEEEISKYFKLIIRKKGYYTIDRTSSYLFYGTELPKYLIEKEDGIYYKPSLIINMMNGKNKEISFVTEKERDLYLKRNFQTLNFLDVL